jgi:hypothetical protein
MNLSSSVRGRRLIGVSLACLLGGTLAYAAPNPPLSEQPVHGGDIVGALSACQTPTAGALVYIPGRSFMAITDAAGNFTLNYVPPGTYTLNVRGADNQEIGSVPDVVVLKNRVTEIGSVLLPCASPDVDGDGFASDVDCNDADPAINPGAAEVCQDAVDNNCDGQADESCPECEVAEDCALGFFCTEAGVCAEQLPDGAACTTNQQCQSQTCLLDVCTQIGS